MDKQGSVAVEPIFWHNKHHTVLLSDISDMKFGNSYYFPNEGFIPLAPLDPDGEIAPPGNNKINIPLFDFHKQKESFMISEPELKDFLRMNKTALAHSDNIVDQMIFEFRVKSLPDSLIIHDFQVDQDWYYISCD